MRLDRLARCARCACRAENCFARHTDKAIQTSSKSWSGISLALDADDSVLRPYCRANILASVMQVRHLGARVPPAQHVECD